MNGAVNGADAEIFTFESITGESEYKWIAFPLQRLLKEKWNDTEHISHADFGWCYLRSMERACILCHAALTKADDKDPTELVTVGGGVKIECNENGKHTLTLSREQVTEIRGHDPINKHHFDVVAKVLEEIYWHFHSNVTRNYCTTIFSNKNDSTEVHAHGGDKGVCDSWFIIKSADFVRHKILAVGEVAAGCWVNEFNSSFGWSADQVPWGVDDTDLQKTPSFLRFRAFTDNPDVRVFLVENKGDSCIHKLVDSNFSEKFGTSVDVFLQDKHDQCKRDYISLSVCCGVRFSHKNIGDGHTPSKDDELLGVFVTLNVKGVDLSVLETISKNIHAASGSIKYILLQNLAREKAIEQDEIQQKLEKQDKVKQKYVEMFSLLTKPLESLTEALAKTQADTQQLRAILYDPWVAIFWCQPMIARLFEPGGQLKIAGRHIEVAHQPSSYGPDDARLVFAEALARVKGNDLNKSKNGVKAGTLLKEQVLEYSQDEESDSPYSKLSKALKKVLGIECWDEVKCDQSLGSYLDLLKMRFYTAYKPGEASKTLNWSVLNSFFSIGVQLESLEINRRSQSAKQNQFSVVAEFGNSLATHGHLIEFIAGVVGKNINDMEQNKVGSDSAVLVSTFVQCPEETNLDRVQIYKHEKAYCCKMVFKSSKVWIENVDELQELLSDQWQYRKDKVRSAGEYGDFHKPFAKLVERFPEEIIKKDSLIIRNGSELCIDLGTLQIKFNDKKFVICSSKKSTCGGE